MPTEARARIKINNLLTEAGWRLIDSTAGKANVKLEAAMRMDDMGADFERIPRGAADYILLDNNLFPVCALEAKSEDKDPLVGKEQARKYAKTQNARYVLLSNGNLHYFWDTEKGNPTRISRFPSLDTLGVLEAFKPDPGKIPAEKVESDYVVLTKAPNYSRDPDWLNPDRRKEFIKKFGLKFLRPYQLNAIHAVQASAAQGKNRFLLEMATGTGKTLVAAALIKLFLRTGNAKRVLFLVDRLELEEQAKKNFERYLEPDFHTAVYKHRRGDWERSEIMVTTIQSISHGNKYLRLFSPTDFQLIISDEAHRSISGENRQIFEYFIGAKLGLTATPRDYLKNVKFSLTDPRELERRTLLSTYETFGCESGEPTFQYTLPDGVRDGCLINPVALDCRTDITTQLLSDEGYALQAPDEEEAAIYHHRDFERRFFSENTNLEFCRTFMAHAARDPLSGEIGKSIVFCVSQHHASKITQALNQLAHEQFPGKYNSDFAVQVTSFIPGAQQMTVQFANNNLNGKTRFLPGYISSRARVCVTVGMMTTGYDCEDLLNLCLMRPIFSPTDFVQIKGRGTRVFSFSYTFQDGGRREVVAKDKEAFKLFDFFANCEYFEEKFPYDEVIQLPALRRPLETGGFPPPIAVADQTHDAEVYLPDPLKSMEVLAFDGNVMRVDRELYASSFQKDASSLPALKAAVENGDQAEAERLAREHLLNRPEMFYTIQSLQKAYAAERPLDLWEILEYIFGLIPGFKSRRELAEEAFERFVQAVGVDNKFYFQAREIFIACLTDKTFRQALADRRFGEYASDPQRFDALKKLGKARIDQLYGYIMDKISLTPFG
ncbi:MAG: DEAD/DEAH box helicase family protein [Pelolinea sp.]|nr:DEAD/DEAH box helicase family protein [Pelolinea sp.]